MPQPLSHDLRVRVLKAYLESNDSYETIAERFGVSVRFIRDLKKRYDETGSVEPRGHGGGAKRRMSDEDLEALKRWVTAHPDWYIREYQERMQAERGVIVSVATMRRALERLGFPRKKRLSTLPSSEPLPSEPNGDSSNS